jgi:hypothetical protein
MEERTVNKAAPAGAGKTFYLWILAAVALSNLVLLLMFKQRPSSAGSAPPPAVANAQSAANTASASPRNPFARGGSRVSMTATELPAEQVVSNKLAQFARSRRAITEGLARKHGLEIQPDVRRFFDALEAGNWTEADGLFQGWMRERREMRDSEVNRPPSVPHELWTAIREAYGVAEVAHAWPAQKLLDYGERVMSSLRPGMVYVGGTDPGRFIPTLLNETSGGERHVVLTQNAFADQSYLKYVEFLYADKLQVLDEKDSQHAFQSYMTDAQARLARGELRPGEDVKVVENRVQVSGQVAVMDINERLLNMFIEKNPGLSFALEESFSLKSTYEGAVPLGPILELRASKDPPTQPQIVAAVDQWRTLSQNISADDLISNARKTYSHMAQAQGNYFAARGFSAEAEQTWQLSREMCPANPEAVNSLYRLWRGNGRANEAEAMLSDFERSYPGQADTVKKIRTSGGTASFAWDGTGAEAK